MIKPLYDPNFDDDEKGLQHSYHNTPPLYSEPQILYSYTYDGFMNDIPNNIFTWNVNYPFVIVSGQGTNTITLQQYPVLTTQRENIIKTNTVSYRNLKYSDLDLDLNGLKESINLYYRQGPLWKIEGNKYPKLTYSSDGRSQTIETYKLIPLFNTDLSKNNIINTESYNFVIKNGNLIKLYGDNPPNGYPLIDVLWHTKGSGYISFYSSWDDDYVKFPNTMSIAVL